MKQEDKRRIKKGDALHFDNYQPARDVKFPGQRSQPASISRQAVDGLDDELLLAVVTREEEMDRGVFGLEPLAVRGEALGLVLPLDEVAALIRRGARPRRMPTTAPVMPMRPRPRRSTWARQADLYT